MEIADKYKDYDFIYVWNPNNDSSGRIVIDGAKSEVEAFYLATQTKEFKHWFDSACAKDGVHYLDNFNDITEKFEYELECVSPSYALAQYKDGFAYWEEIGVIEDE